MIAGPAGHAELFGGFGNHDTYLFWSRRDAQREGELLARKMGQQRVNWSVVDDDLVIGRVERSDVVIVCKGVWLPDTPPPPHLQRRYRWLRQGKEDAHDEQQ